MQTSPETTPEADSSLAREKESSLEQRIAKLMEDISRDAMIEKCELLPQSGSSRKYFRIRYKDLAGSDNQTILAAYNDNIKENLAYFSFTRQFLSHNLKVPRILSVSPDQTLYLVEDLGDTTLFSLLPSPEVSVENISLVKLYEKVVENLIRFQRIPDMDYTHVFPVEDFNATSMAWDLNYFKYFFLRMTGFSFSEPELETDFRTITGFLNREQHLSFMYRDFQSRNIMIKDSEPWFIDFQGGRRGPLAYDLVSLLYDAKANLSEEMRRYLFQYYCRQASLHIHGFCQENFLKEFRVCQLLRILQAMGAYGLRGFIEKKSLFLKSVPYAIQNLGKLMESEDFPLFLPEIRHIIKQMQASPLARFGKPGSEKLTIDVCSFSLRQGYPPCDPEHGGGFVFDCRFLPNPGRYPQYRDLTGRSPEVRLFLEQRKEVSVFLQNAFEMLKPAVLNYIEREFSHLSIAFGCTGGQHRSVYCAEKMSSMLHDAFDVKVNTIHLVHPE